MWFSRDEAHLMLTIRLFMNLLIVMLCWTVPMFLFFLITTLACIAITLHIRDATIFLQHKLMHHPMTHDKLECCDWMPG